MILPVPVMTDDVYSSLAMCSRRREGKLELLLFYCEELQTEK